MSHSSTREVSDRGQTEPLAAIVAIASIALAIGVYAVVVTDALDTGSERAVEKTTIDLVWDDVAVDGAYPADSDLSESIDRGSLPEGYNVYVNVSRFTDDGERETIGEARFAWDGESVVEESPGSVRSTTRPIPIRFAPGTVRQGTLRVEVWEP